MKQEKGRVDLTLPIVSPEIDRYMRTLVSSTDHSVLLEMEAYAQQHNFPIVNRLVGIFLEMQAKMIQAKRVFEFGSGYGYSAYWFAKAVGAEGEVICSDMNPANRTAAEQYYGSGSISRSKKHKMLLQKPKVYLIFAITMPTKKVIQKFGKWQKTEYALAGCISLIMCCGAGESLYRMTSILPTA